MISPVVVRVSHNRFRRGKARLVVSLEKPPIGDQTGFAFGCDTQDDVFRKLSADLQGKAADDEIRSQMARLLDEARAKVADDTVGHN